MCSVSGAAELLDVKHLTGDVPKFLLGIETARHSHRLGHRRVFEVTAVQVLHFRGQGHVERAVSTLSLRLRKIKKEL